MSKFDHSPVRLEDFVAADSGDVQAQIFVGTALLKGKVIALDKKRGLEYIQAAADAGSIDARYRIAFIKEIDRDISFLTEMKALVKAGYTPAMNELGNAYWMGWVVKQNKYRAGVYFRMAARSGNALAEVRYQRLPLEKPFVYNLSFVARVYVWFRVFFNRFLLAYKIIKERDAGIWHGRI